MIHAFFILSLVISCGFSWEYISLMKEYYLLCGPDYFCSNYPESIRPLKSYRHLKICPECECDSECIKRGDCCPDIFFKLPELKCVNRTIIGQSQHVSSTSELMVTSCPADVSLDLKRKCENQTDIKFRLMHFPVDGGEMLLTYYNKYCAECHGITDFELWSLDIKCDEFADFNYLNTLNDVIRLAYERKCLFEAYDLRYANIPSPCYDSGNTTIFSHCNETGLWENLEVSVGYACESEFRGKFRMFKNIFCYMCNPSLHETLQEEVIGECNTTGQWETYDEGLERSCLYLSQSMATTPYKNIFCYLCNRRNDSSELFIDASSHFSESLIDDKVFHFQYDIDISSFDLSYFKHTIQEEIMKTKNLSNEVNIPFSVSTFTTSDLSVINIDNLLTQRLSLLDEEVGVCNARRPLVAPYNYRACSCDPMCLFDQNLTCCLDLTLEQSTTCRDELELSPTDQPKKGFLVINSCLQEKTYDVYKQGCSMATRKNIFSLLPVNIHGTHFTYNNLHCIICNVDSTAYMSKMNNESMDSKSEEVRTMFSATDEYASRQADYDIWSLQILCPRYLDYSHYVTIGTIIQTAWFLKCRVFYKNGVKTNPTCDYFEFSSCDLQAKWTYTDPDVEWACNNVMSLGRLPKIKFSTVFPEEFEVDNDLKPSITKFTNLFCALCKPDFNHTASFIDTCNVTGHWKRYDPIAEANCLQLPQIYYFYPYKNSHCLLCNGMGRSLYKSETGPSAYPSYKRIPGFTWFPVLRNLFSVSPNDDAFVNYFDEDTQCKDGQFFDHIQGRCRNITCFDGKYLSNFTCHSLLDITKNLRYSMQLYVKISSQKPTASKDLARTAIFQIKDEVTAIEKEKVLIEEINLEVSGSCSKKIDPDSFLYLTMDVTVFVHHSVNRLQVENKLNNIMYKKSINRSNTTTFVEFSGTKYSMENNTDSIPTPSELLDKVRPPPDLPMFPSGQSLPLFDLGCAFGEADAFPRLQYLPNMYYKAKVSNALVCRQIELNEEEYNMTKTDEDVTLTLTRQNVEIEINQYAITPGNKVRVCYDYLQEIGYFGTTVDGKKSASQMQKSLWIISTVCTSVSIMCLVISLIIYCVFPSLRTTPGKLIMLMMMSLLFTLLFLELTFQAIVWDTGCTIVGVILHFSWLSVFTSMSACNFHMFKVFTSRKSHKPSTTTFCDRKIVLHTIYIFGTPLCITLTYMVTQLIMSNGASTGYGGMKCFVINRLGIILTFIVPVCVICITNILFYIITIKTIHNTPKPDGTSRNEISIFLRLTSITGVSWLLQIIDSFLPLSAFSIIATIINSLQGLFIFMAFTINKRNIAVVRERLQLKSKSKFKFTPVSENSSGDLGKGPEKSPSTGSTRL